MSYPKRRRYAPRDEAELAHHPVGVVPDRTLEELTGYDRRWIGEQRRRLGIAAPPSHHHPWLTDLVRRWSRDRLDAWMDSLDERRAAVRHLRSRARSVINMLTPGSLDSSLDIVDVASEFEQRKEGAHEVATTDDDVDARLHAAGTGASGDPGEGVSLGGDELRRLHVDARVDGAPAHQLLRGAGGEADPESGRGLLPVPDAGAADPGVGDDAAAVLPSVPRAGVEGDRDVRGPEARTEGSEVGRVRGHRRIRLVGSAGDPALTDDERAELAARRPKTRGDCASGPRPCPWAGCRYHLLIDVNSAGTLRSNEQHDDPTQLEDSCALDLADQGPQTLERIAGVLGMTRERVRQIESGLVELLRVARVGRPLEAYVGAFDGTGELVYPKEDGDG